MDGDIAPTSQISLLQIINLLLTQISGHRLVSTEVISPALISSISA
jgi:hypothetical protein